MYIKESPASGLIAGRCAGGDANRVAVAAAAAAAPHRFTPFNLTAFRNSVRLFDDRIGMSRRVGLLVQFDGRRSDERTCLPLLTL